MIQLNTATSYLEYPQAAPQGQTHEPSSTSLVPPRQETRGVDTVEISPEGRHLQQKKEGANQDPPSKAPNPDSPEAKANEQKIQELKKRDKEVRMHEQAHLAAAGGHAKGGAQYEYVRGPDGKNYANGGEVSIDVSPEKTPEATLAKARQVKSAALAPADPSPQDRQVARAAEQMAQEAMKELQNAQDSTKSNQARKELGGYTSTTASKQSSIDIFA